MNKKAICLLSDGLDSPVATFLLEQKGIEVIGLNFINHPYVGPVIKSKDNKIKEVKSYIKEISQTLVNAFSTQNQFTLYQMPQGLDLKKIIEASSDPKYTCVLCKRLMFKKAEFLANKVNAQLIATGDILGEQASQTIENLKIIQESLTNKKVVRPNIGLNKLEVTNIARKIGTNQHSEKAAKYTCLAVPIKPATKAPLDLIAKIEKEININQLISESWKEKKKFLFQKED